MYYKVDIFFRNVHHLSDGRFAAGVWAKWASFNFDKESEHYISPVQASEIIGWMSGPTIVAEFGKETKEESIVEITKLLNIHSIAIPASLLSDNLKSQFNEIILNDSEDSEYPCFTKTINSNSSSFYYPTLTAKGANEVKESGVNNICIEGVKEEKPGTANFEVQSLFLEELELDK